MLYGVVFCKDFLQKLPHELLIIYVRADSWNRNYLLTNSEIVLIPMCFCPFRFFISLFFRTFAHEMGKKTPSDSPEGGE